MSSTTTAEGGAARQRLKARIGFSLIVLFSVVCMLSVVSVIGAWAQGGESASQPITAERAEVLKWGLIAAAIAFGFGALGAGIAIAHVGAAAMGAIGEKPEIAGQAIIFVGLAEGVVVFGFITAIMILGRLG
jgi:V/A-type H+-transporting ATPase subunit K